VTRYVSNTSILIRPPTSATLEKVTALSESKVSPKITNFLVQRQGISAPSAGTAWLADYTSVRAATRIAPLGRSSAGLADNG